MRILMFIDEMLAVMNHFYWLLRQGRPVAIFSLLIVILAILVHFANGNPAFFISDGLIVWKIYNYFRNHYIDAHYP